MSYDRDSSVSRRKRAGGRTVNLDACRVELSRPLCVARSLKEFWYPNIMQNHGGTSSYTGIVEIQPNRLLYVYDRVPDTFRSRTFWKAAPEAGSDVRGQFSVYAASVTVLEA